jgi:uncharacterized membrane protein
VKKKPYLLVVIVLVVFLWIPVNGQNSTTEDADILLDPLSISGAMMSNGTTLVTIDGRVTNLGMSPITTVSLRFDSLEIGILVASLGNELVEYTTTQMERHTMIILYSPQVIDSNESQWIHIELMSTDLQTEPRVGDTREFIEGRFVFYMRPHSRVANFTFSAILPSHASLTHESTVPVFPMADGNFTDGESITFFWNTAQLDPGQERAFIVKFNLLNTIESDSEFQFTDIIITGIFGIVVGVAATIGVPRIITRARKMGRTKYVGLTSEEEEIQTILKQNDGSCSQKELHTMIGVSESKISLLLGNLEQRGMIRRFREGRENIVYLMESAE